MKEYKRETISKIISLVNKNVLLPDIQRPFVWDEQQVYKLFDSLMRGYPISTFLFWDLTIEQLEATEEKENLRIKMYKFVDSNEKDNEEELNRGRDTYFLVLDGQQRLTSLFIALKGTWRKKIRRATVESYLFLSLCYKMAINFQPITKGNLPEQDHIFSRDELQKAGVPSEKINSIYNIRYVTANDNRSKANTPFSEWVECLREKNKKEDVFKTHLIPDGYLSADRFDEFLLARKKELLLIVL